jgi:hypothetical protein
MALYAFDGTHRQDEVEHERDTNVVRFARAYRGRRFYRPGVGTRLGFVGRVFGGWLGAGLQERVQEGLDVLARNQAHGDHDIDIVGFSRGAASAVHFANEIWERARKAKTEPPPIRFVGLFDTVASTGLLPDEIDVNLDLEVPPNVRTCCHAMALDEGRASYFLHRMRPRKASPGGSTIEEVWFRGCHSDVGGGHRRDGLANIPLCWMFRRAAEAGLAFEEDEVASAMAGRQRDTAIVRARLDKGHGRRRVDPGDLVHGSVTPRETVESIWHLNPPDGCGVVGDAGEPLGRFPTIAAWPADIDWKRALVPRLILQAGTPPIRMDVLADTEWNELPHIYLEAGNTYRFEVAGAPEDWIDGEVTETNGADGYELPALRPFKRLARFPDAGWFALIGAIDRTELFRIGSGCEHTPQRSGDFSCFANDAWFKYGNNRGVLRLDVRRVG